MVGKKLSKEEFERSFELAPRAAVNLLIVNSKNGVLLTKRAIPPSKNYWHLPGSFIRKGETLEDCLSRVAKKELRIEISPVETELAGVFEDIDKDPRGHVVDIVYRFNLPDEIQPTTTEETEEVRFFTKLPDQIGFNHRETLQKLGFI